MIITAQKRRDRAEKQQRFCVPIKLHCYKFKMLILIAGVTTKVTKKYIEKDFRKELK